MRAVSHVLRPIRLTVRVGAAHQAPTPSGPHAEQVRLPGHPGHGIHGGLLVDGSRQDARVSRAHSVQPLAPIELHLVPSAAPPQSVQLDDRRSTLRNGFDLLLRQGLDATAVLGQPFRREEADEPHLNLIKRQGVTVLPGSSQFSPRDFRPHEMSVFRDPPVELVDIGIALGTRHRQVRRIRILIRQRGPQCERRNQQSAPDCPHTDGRRPSARPRCLRIGEECRQPPHGSQQPTQHSTQTLRPEPGRKCHPHEKQRQGPGQRPHGPGQ